MFAFLYNIGNVNIVNRSRDSRIHSGIRRCLLSGSACHRAQVHHRLPDVLQIRQQGSQGGVDIDQLLLLLLLLLGLVNIVGDGDIAICDIATCPLFSQLLAQFNDQVAVNFTRQRVKPCSMLVLSTSN